MKKIVIISLLALVAGACGNTATVQQTNTNAVSNSTTRSGDQLIVTSHSTEKPPANKSGGSPMEKPVDVSDLTEKIEKADKDFKAKPNDGKAKEALATAYFGRAFVLTKAAQYKSALGDFRKGLKLNPDDKEAQEMHDKIVSIFKSMNRELPKEGEEPPPLEAK